MILLDFRVLGPGPIRPLMWHLRAGVDLEALGRHSVSAAPADFGMKYHLTLSGNIPAVFRHQFPGRTRPLRAPRGTTEKRFFLFLQIVDLQDIL